MTGPDDAASDDAPVVAPLDLDAVRTVQVGTVIWALLFVILLPFHNRLAANDHTWWLWTCLIATLLGLVGIAFTTRRRRRIRQRTQQPS